MTDHVLSRPISPLFAPVARAARGAEHLDATFPGWALEVCRRLGGIAQRYREVPEPYESVDFVGWAGFAGELELFVVRKGLDLPFLLQGGELHTHSYWMHGFIYWTPVWQTPTEDDRVLDAAWAFEVWRRQRAAQVKGFLPKVRITDDMVRLLRVGLLTIPKGQWVQLAWSDKPARWVGVSPGGILQVMHYPRWRDTADFAEACRTWNQADPTALLPFPQDCLDKLRSAS